MSDTQKKKETPKAQATGTLQAKETDIAQHIASVLAEIVKANPGDVDSVTAIGEIMLDSLMSLVAPPQTREDQMKQDLFQIEVLKRSGTLPPDTLKQLIATQHNIEVQMGLRAPAEVYDFSQDQGTGFAERGPEGAREYAFMGGGGQWHAEGSPGHLAGQQQISDYETKANSVLTEPGRIMTHLQKQIDAQKEDKKFAELEAERDRVAIWGRAGGKASELGTGKGIYTDTPWSADEQKHMWEQGHRESAAKPGGGGTGAGAEPSTSPRIGTPGGSMVPGSGPGGGPSGLWSAAGDAFRGAKGRLDEMKQGLHGWLDEMGTPLPAGRTEPSPKAVQARKNAEDLRQSLLEQKRKEGKLSASQ